MESLCIVVWYKLGFLRTTVSRRAFSGHLLKLCKDGSVEPRCFWNRTEEHECLG